jgi:cobalt-zinc-cadmium efflux system outer membrane protein
MAPDFKVGPYFSQETAGEDALNMGMVLAMSLPLWNWNQGGIDTAKARQEKAYWLKQDAARQVRMVIYQRIRAYTLALEHLQATPARDINMLSQSAGLADRQYRTGAVGIQLLLEMQRQFLAALRTRNQSLLEAWQSWLDLDLLTAGGCLPTRQAQSVSTAGTNP